MDSASAELKNAAGQVVARAQFAQNAQGVIKLRVEAKGLPAGDHGMHIHAVGKCDPPDFTSAGGHYNPLGKKHGLLSPEGPHAGDLPGLVVASDGTAHYDTTTDRVTLSAGATTVFDADGSVLIIHANPDDQVTDPTGNAGGRTACGIIARAPAFIAPAVDSASAEFKNAAGQVVGSAQFAQDARGIVQIKVDVKGLPAGERGMHIHAVGKCDPPDFTSAGAHYNPLAKKHGLLSPEGPHAGDLPGLPVAADGTARQEVTTDRVTLSAGATTLFDADGSVLIIHANPDDQVTDPTGNAGGRIACGVIVRPAALPPTGGDPQGGSAPWLALALAALGGLLLAAPATFWALRRVYQR